MLNDLTPASFEAHLGTLFRIQIDGSNPFELTLFEVKRHEPHPGPRSEPFSAYFRTPFASFVLPQHIYHLEHEGLGHLELFLVPLGPDPQRQGMLYEAVFN